jgi:ParB family chromosome partitioning protein
MRIHHFTEIRPLILLEPEKITPNTAQPRQTFLDETIASLADSIRENGILQPLTVRKTKEG